MTIEEQFNEWFTSNATEFTFICEQFYGDCELTDVELRKKLLKGWLECAYKQGRNDFIEEAIPVVLYGDIDETPLNIVKEHLGELDDDGNPDYYWIASLDDEQQTRLAVAATLRGMKDETT
jgi:hypothetical protein